MLLLHGSCVSAFEFDWRFSTSRNIVGEPSNVLSNGARLTGVFAVAGMLSDRLALLEPEKVKVQLSPQVIYNCLEVDADLWNLSAILQTVIRNDGIPDRTCMSFRAEKEECTVENQCINCLPGDDCYSRHSYFMYPISPRIYEVPSSNLRAEIVLNGPVACKLRDMFGVLIGFKENKTFVVRYDFGTAFKQGGYGEVEMDDIHECWSGHPGYPYRRYNNNLQMKPRRMDSRRSSSSCSNRGKLGLCGGNNRFRQSLVEYAPLPRSFRWPEDSLTPTQSHHTGPEYCGACWAMASASTYSDRLRILTGGPNATNTFVSPQNTIDCVDGGCWGGDVEAVFPFWKSHGTVDESCNPWKSERENCLDSGAHCRLCNVNGTHCAGAPQDAFKVYRVRDWGCIRGEIEMMIEIYFNGPIDCGIATPPTLDEDYFGSDILCDEDTPKKDWEVSHDVEVVGWGEEEGVGKYWIIRNSWSTAWGDRGFAKICRGRRQDAPVGNMKLESQCTFVNPKL